MFSREIQQLYSELSHTDPVRLKQFASQGGWRKLTIESGKASPSSVFDIQGIVSWSLSRMLEWLPPVGDEYRRSRVAQAILDNRSSVW